VRQEDGSAEPVTIEEILADPAASLWLKAALRSALSRDPVDAANDADVLARVLNDRCRHLLEEPQRPRHSRPVNQRASCANG
jgi:hypothetical protein